MARTAPRLFTIPASAPFMPTLVAALLAGRLVPDFPASSADPLALANATLFLPTRRACRLAQDVFRDAIGRDAAILPRIVPIGDIDEDEIAFAQMAAGPLGGEALEMPDALGALDRRIMLAQLILRWAQTIRPAEGAALVASTPAAALALADDLGRLMDDMATRQVSWDRLDRLVPTDMDEYWELSLRFLKIAREAWPAILAENNAIEAAVRRDRLIALEAERLKGHPGPVIAAGSTGSMPATAMLLETIARLPQGAVVLPGLDTDLDEAAWTMIEGRRDLLGDDPAPAYNHPQFAMQALLRRMGARRADVEALARRAPHGRERLVSEAMRPAASSEHWQARIATPEFGAYADAALASLTVIEAANAEEEALSIAIALREAVERPGETAALVTPDRGLARRVIAALARWNVAVDDSGGDPLAETGAGIFARMVAEAALGGLEPVPLLAMLKHPLLRLNANAGAFADNIAALEFAVLRGPRPRGGSAGLTQALAHFRNTPRHHRDPRARLSPRRIAGAERLAERLAAALAPLERLGPAPQPFAVLADAHRQVIESLSRDAYGHAAAFADRDGEALAELFDEIGESGSAASLRVAPADYADTFRALLDRPVRRPGAPGSRVRIYGPLEARLQQTGRVVLGGLVEGGWPPEMRSDPWLSRPMRRELGLDPPERRIGLSAHDFAQMLGAREVFLTRATKIAGAPTVASRFVQRLAAVAGERWLPVVKRGEAYLAWARHLDMPEAITPIARPAPKPPLAARPTQLSVTEIEHWLRDPYTIYAKHILRLVPLDPVDAPPGSRDRGTVIHEAIGEFARTFPTVLPSDPEAVLTEIGERRFRPLESYPEARAFWWPRFRRIAAWFADFETRRRRDLAALHAEIGGQLDIPLGATVLRLTTRADRIERLKDGSYAVLDYKTGTPPTEKQVGAGISPQLTLEAAILRNGGFDGIPKGSTVSSLIYVALRGGELPGEEKPILFADTSPDAQADRALARLTDVAARFAREDTPYLALVQPMWRTRYGDYDHLARVKEWSLIGDGDEGGEE